MLFQLGYPSPLSWPGTWTGGGEGTPSCWWGKGYPGTPHPDLEPGQGGTPLSRPGMGYPLVQTWDGVPPSRSRPGMGYPTPSRPETGYPPPPKWWTKWKHYLPSDAGGKKQLSAVKLTNCWWPWFERMDHAQEFTAIQELLMTSVLEFRALKCCDFA